MTNQASLSAKPNQGRARGVVPIASCYALTVKVVAGKTILVRRKA